MIGFITDEEQIDNGHKVKQKSIPEMFPEYDFKMAHEELKKYNVIFGISAIIPILWPTLITMCVRILFSIQKVIYFMSENSIYPKLSLVDKI